MTHAKKSRAALAQLAGMNPDTWDYRKQINNIYIQDLRQEDIAVITEEQDRILNIWIPAIQRQRQNNKAFDWVLENLNQLQIIRLNLVNANLNRSYDTALLYDAQGHYIPTPTPGEYTPDYAVISFGDE